MGKDQDLLRYVKLEDASAVKKMLFKAIKQGKKRVGSMKRLNVNYQDADGMTCLHQAALMGNASIMWSLLESGCYVDLTDKKGMLALHYAAWQGKPDPVYVLLLKGSPVNIKSKNSDTALHLACQHGHSEVAYMLINHGADPCLRNSERKSCFDIACEYGRAQLVETLIHLPLCSGLLKDSHEDMLSNQSSTCIHLAVKNGHADVLRILLRAGVNVNRLTHKGTPLHAAALSGRLDMVKLLIENGADVNKTNSFDQTALDVVNQTTTTRISRDIKAYLKQAGITLYGRAVIDYINPYDSGSLHLKRGDIVIITEQHPDGFWRGYMRREGKGGRVGTFPAEAVSISDTQGVTRHYHYPNTTAVLSRASTYTVIPDHMSVGHDETFPPPPSPLIAKRDHLPDHHLSESYLLNGHTFQHRPIVHVSGTGSQNNIEAGIGSFAFGDYSMTNGSTSSMSTTKDSPNNSNRNSGSSTDSGRGVSTGHLDVKNVASGHRLSNHSNESGVSSRRSYHSNSSSSSRGSLDRLDESPYHTARISVPDLIEAKWADEDVMLAWLKSFQYDHYFSLFQQACYDMKTISRMTPEDLTAIGVTRPTDRKKLKSEIAKLRIDDGIPDWKPSDLYTWLKYLGIELYYETLCAQGYESLDLVTKITWEDLEDIGITMLGHQKKISLAIDRLKRIESGNTNAFTKSENDSSSVHPYHNSTQRDLANHVVIKVNTKQSTSNDSSPTSSCRELSTFQQQKTRDGMFKKAASPLTYSSDSSRITTSSNRVSSSDSGDCITVDGVCDILSSPPLSKQKPIARIVAKSKYSNHDADSDDTDFNEFRKEGSSERSTPTNMTHTSSSAESKLPIETWKTPIVSMTNGAGKPLLLPKPSYSLSAQGSVAPSSKSNGYNNKPPNVSTEYDGPKKPPPPPKRTHSVSKDSNSLERSNYRKATHQSPDYDKLSSARSALPPPTPPKPNTFCPVSNFANETSLKTNNKSLQKQQPALTDYLKSLSEKFGSGKCPDSNDSCNLSDSDDFPPPPPPMAMELIKPDYSILSKSSCDTPDRLVLSPKKQQPIQNTLSNLDRSLKTFSHTDKQSLSDKTDMQPKLSVADMFVNNDLTGSTTSVDSNTLPFANENVGTIKQKIVSSKPSIVELTTNGTGDRAVVLDTCFYEGRSSTLKRTSSCQQQNVYYSNHQRSHSQERHEFQSNTNSSVSAIQDVTMLKDEECDDTTDIYDDIDNMLQGLTNELDAMMVQEGFQ